MKFRFQVSKSTIGKALCGAIGDDIKNEVHVLKVFFERGSKVESLMMVIIKVVIIKASFGSS